MLAQGNAATGQAHHRGKASGRGPYRLAAAQNSQIWIARVLISIALTSQRNGGDCGEAAYFVAADNHESMEETDYLMRSPANATRLMAAAEEVRHVGQCCVRQRDVLDSLHGRKIPLR